MKLRLYAGRRFDSRANPAKSALCLCGGGITGALYEAGVLAGLDDALGRAVASQFDVYVGSSAGASVASVVSQGVCARRLFDALRDPADGYFPLRRRDVYRAEPLRWVRSAGRLLAGVGRTLAARLRHHDLDLADELASLHDLLPEGLYRLDHYAAFLRAFYRREGLATRFSELKRELYVVANDLDSAERVVFGDGLLREVELADAIAASSAVPVFFEPVHIGGRDHIDGGVGRVAHVDVAFEHGATRILVVNPTVPIRNDPERVCLPTRHGSCARLREKGPLYIANQAYRIMAKARLHFGIKRYLAEHPRGAVLLAEPEDHETLLFLNGAMGLRARAHILDDARAGARLAFAPLAADLWASQDPSAPVPLRDIDADQR